MQRNHLASFLLPVLLLPLTFNAALAESTLADMIQSGRRTAALELLDAGTDVNAAQNDGTTALHWAVYRSDIPLVQQLLEQGASAAVANRYGSSPLTEAVKLANVELVEMLLDAGAEPDSPNEDGQTALMLAARTGSLEVAERLVAHGANVNARESWRGQTALMWAADGHFPELTLFLIEQGAEVSTRAIVNDWGAQFTSEPRAQFRPTGGLTPLLYAARAGCVDCISAIVAAGEHIDRPTPEGVTALMLAIDNLRFEAATQLIAAGANPHHADWWGRTALYLAVDMHSYPSGVENGNPEAMPIIEQLLAASVEVNTQLNMHRVGRGGNSQRFTDDLLTTGATPLLRAAITHDHEAMRLLLERGAHVDLPNVMGVTPLMAAVSLGVRDIDFGTNRSPSFATDERIEDKVIGSLEILLAAGADINARVTDTSSRTARIARPSGMTDREGQTALYAAAAQRWTRVIEFMLANGADVDIVDSLGRSPL